MLTSIDNFLNSIRDGISGVDADILLYAIVGINLLLGLFLLIAACCAHNKTSKKMKAALAKGEKCKSSPIIDLLPRGAGVMIPVAFLLFAFAVIVFEFISLIPYLGIIVFEIFNIVSRIIYKAKTKKVKKLYVIYHDEYEREAEIQFETNEPYYEVKHESKEAEEHKHEPLHDEQNPEQKFEHAEPLTTPTVIMPHTETKKPETAQPVTPPSAPKQTPPQTPSQTPPQTVVPPRAAVKPEQEEKKNNAYQPFETKRPVTQTTDYNIERAPTYQTPRPPENPPVVNFARQETEKTEVKKSEPLSRDAYTIDDIVERINQIKKEGATKATMTELIYIIQKEREKNENKNPEQRQKLSEALSELLKAMNKAN